ncbi:MAG: DUF2867 domain-containing protein [Chromatiales bacterium]|nr:DUF2867 domain-containing protein [Chromatiales bacterium]
MLDAGGPDAVTYEEIMRCYGELVGRRPLHRAGAGADAAAVVVLAALRHVGAGQRRAGAGRGPGARLRRARRRAAARWCRGALTGPRGGRARRDRGGPQRTRSIARWVEGAIACRNFRPSTRFYAKRAGATAAAPATPERVFARGLHASAATTATSTPTACGGSARALDWLVGGPSFRRSRRHPTELRVGDVVDSWRVIALEPGRRLTLLMEMKAPGAGVLEFVVQPGRAARARASAPRPTGTRPACWGLAVLVRAGAGAPVPVPRPDARHRERARRPLTDHSGSCELARAEVVAHRRAT